MHQDQEGLLRCPVLMLSTGYEPLFQTTWKRALTAVFGGRAEIVESHKTLKIGTPSGSFPYPVKVRFITGVVAGKIKSLDRCAPLSRKNIYLRDKGVCQYCCKSVTLKAGTVDHIIPKSRGGPHSWENVVLSCNKCNQKKGASRLRDTGMLLKKMPRVPGLSEMIYTKS